VNVARVVAGVPKNRPPLSVTGVPPVLAAKLGLQEEKNGPAWAEGWNEITRVPVPVCVPTVAVARTLASPAFDEQRAVTEAPPVVVTDTTTLLFCWKKPKSVENATPVPSGTLLPFNVTMAWISVQLPPSGWRSS
jgi:hypothetical protein